MPDGGRLGQLGAPCRAGTAVGSRGSVHTSDHRVVGEKSHASRQTTAMSDVRCCIGDSLFTDGDARLSRQAAGHSLSD